MAERWVSQSEAARLETAAGRPVNQSSISRFIAANPDVPVKRNERGAVQFVEYEALAAARSGSLSVQDKLADRDVPAPVAAPVQPAAPIAPSATERQRMASAERAELDLAERKGEVMDRAAVAHVVETAGVNFTQALERRRRTLAQQVAGLEDLRSIELILKKADNELLRKLAQDLRGEAAEGEPEAA